MLAVLAHGNQRSIASNSLNAQRTVGRLSGTRGDCTDASSHEGTLAMLRHCFLLLGLVAAMTVSSGGCRSCDNCHDYGPPVANCDCNACGTHRAGSASGGYVSGEHAEEVTSEQPGQKDGQSTPQPASQR